MHQNFEITLRHNARIGTYCNIEIPCADHLRRILLRLGIRFQLDPPSAASLAQPAHSIFVFGEWPPYQLGDILMNEDFKIRVAPELQSTESTYPPPVQKLLTLPLADEDDPPDYLALGIRPEHIPDLLRLAADPELCTASCAAMAPGDHAILALGQLRAVEVVRPLLSMLQRVTEDVSCELGDNISAALGRMGPPALSPIIEYLRNHAPHALAEDAASVAVANIGLNYPDSRNKCVAALCELLEQFPTNPVSLNTSLVGALLDLAAVETMPLIERAFQAGSIDEQTLDWNSVLVEFGFKEDDFSDLSGLE